MLILIKNHNDIQPVQTNRPLELDEYNEHNYLSPRNGFNDIFDDPDDHTYAEPYQRSCEFFRNNDSDRVYLYSMIDKCSDNFYLLIIRD